MTRYPCFPDRTILDLNGFWEFQWLGAADWSTIDPRRFVPETVMAVPGVFDSLPAYGQVRGVGCYRRRLPDDFAPGERLRLTIGGLGLYARLWFDGTPLGECLLPYSSGHWDITVERRGGHELCLAIDNRFDPERVPLFNPNYDFYGYGGIYREVALHRRLPACTLEHVQVIPLDPARGTVRLRVELQGQVPEPVALTVAFDGGAPQTFRQPATHGCLALDLTVPDPRPWSPARPALHTVEVSIPGDRRRDRFGLRTITTQGRELLLNGEPLQLRGFNRHECHPQLGPVQTEALMLADLQWLQRLHGNFVRCVHYPQDERFFELCDELGILAWSESLGWGNRLPQLAQPRFADLQEEQTRRMVRQACNHPSIILWAFLNEADSSAVEALPLYRRLVAAIRAEDPSRLVTYASMFGTRDRGFDLVDVISLNTYPGWISNLDWAVPSSERIAPHLASLVEAFAKTPAWADKPLFLSEIGACGLYGCHDLARSQWTEEYQADYMAAAARAILDDPRLCGVALWQLVDSRSYGPSGDVRCKPRGINNAGVLDEYRRPKLAVTAVAEVFAEAEKHRAP